MVASAVGASAMQQLLQELHARFADLGEGAVADYIPELAKADPAGFGIVVATADGRVYEVGDTTVPFTIQSISKPFVYGLALKLLGVEYMKQRVGVEPSGEAFNAISLDAKTGIPRNPMINAGAIATAAQIRRHLGEQAESVVLDFFADLAGRELAIDDLVYRSERETGHRNRAIAHLLRNFDVVEGLPEDGLDLYFRQCSIAVTCRDLAVMAATLACQGRNPVTGQQPLEPEIAVQMLALMGSCGMYDYAGQWIYDVGMPAKSGVAGGVLAVVPGRLGLAVYSPPLDSFGNSVRGIAVCEALSRHFALHVFDQNPASRPTIRRLATGLDLQSRRWRGAGEDQRLRQHGDGIRIVQAQGVLDLAATEQLLATLQQQVPHAQAMILDLAYVTHLSASCRQLLVQQLQEFAQTGLCIVLSRAGHLPDLLEQGQIFIRHHLSLDRALEEAEDALLARSSVPGAESRGIQPSKNLLDRLDLPGRAALEPLLERCPYPRGTAVVRLGEPGRALYLVESGLFSASLPPSGDRPGATRSRLATFSPGTSFGEIGCLTGQPCTADVLAETDGVCWVLHREVLDRLRSSQPDLAIQLVLILFADLGEKLARTSQQLNLLEQT